MITWVHRSTRGWAYGNSIVDPRTASYQRQRHARSQRARQDFLIGTD